MSDVRHISADESQSTGHGGYTLQGLALYAQHLREQAGDSQYALAGALGVTQPAIQQALQGGNVPTLRRIITYYTGAQVHARYHVGAPPLERSQADLADGIDYLPDE